MSRSNFSTIKSFSKGGLSTNKLNQAISEVEDCMRIVVQAKDVKPIEIGNYVDIDKKSDAVLNYGKLLVEFADLLRLTTINSLDETLKLDYFYLTDENNSDKDSVVSKDKMTVDISQIIEQIDCIESWLGE